MNEYIAVVIAALASFPAAVEKDGLRVEVSISSQVYTFRITNGTDSPITRFEVGTYHTYDYQGPPGWEFADADDRLVASTTERRRAIAPGRTAVFSARVASGTASMGVSPARFEFGDGRAPITLDAIWSPEPHPAGMLALIAGCVGGIALLHTVIVLRGTRGERD